MMEKTVRLVKDKDVKILNAKSSLIPVLLEQGWVEEKEDKKPKEKVSEK